MNIFGTLEFFDNALGKTNLLFDDFYPDIDQARKIYFKRLTAKPDYQIFFDMYKWFNSASRCSGLSANTKKDKVLRNKFCN